MKELKLAYSKILPFKGFYAITIFGKIIRRKEYENMPLSIYTLNHEGIHALQANDFCRGFIGYLIFYILYFLEWLLKLIPCLICKKRPYYSISFEQEAHNYDRNLKYQDIRSRFAWTKYIFKLV